MGPPKKVPLILGNSHIGPGVLRLRQAILSSLCQRYIMLRQFIGTALEPFNLGFGHTLVQKSLSFSATHQIGWGSCLSSCSKHFEWPCTMSARSAGWLLSVQQTSREHVFLGYWRIIPKLDNQDIFTIGPKKLRNRCVMP